MTPLSGAERQRRYRQRHPEKQHEDHVKRYAKDPEKERRRVRVYHANNRDKVHEYNHQYGVTHKEQQVAKAIRWNKENPAKKAEIDKRYRSAHPDKTREHRRASNQNRRAKEKGADGKHTIADIRQRYKQQKEKCYYCNVHLSGHYEIDHVIPISRGGSNGIDNLVLTCRFCNRSKGDKLPHEWSKGGRLL